MVSKKRGFTLIELLVVVAIIGLLASIVFASLGSARRNGRIAAAQGTMRNITTSLILCWDNDTADTNIPASDSQNGGGIDVCDDTTVTTTKYGALPSGWVYCDGTNTGTCDGEDVSAANPVTLIAKGDKEITCTEGGCVTKDAD